MRQKKIYSNSCAVRKKISERNKNHNPPPLQVKWSVPNLYMTSQATELDINCEIIWAKISTPGNKILYLGTYYRPPSDKGVSLEQRNTSLYKACNKTNSFI